MKQQVIKGLSPMSNRRGPWSGQLLISGAGSFELLAGLSTDPGVRANGHCIVALIQMPQTWSWTTDDPIVCETVARMLEAMGEVTPAQLEGIGFVGQGWERVGSG